MKGKIMGTLTFVFSSVSTGELVVQNPGYEEGSPAWNDWIDEICADVATGRRIPEEVTVDEWTLEDIED